MNNLNPATKKAESAQGAQVANQDKTAKEIKISSLNDKFKPEPFKSPEERILRAKEFEALSTRYQLLKLKSHELETFIQGNDKTGSKLTLTNTAGFNFDISNTNVIDKLVKCAKQELDILLNDTKNEVLTFEM